MFLKNKHFLDIVFMHRNSHKEIEWGFLMAVSHTMVNFTFSGLQLLTASMICVFAFTSSLVFLYSFTALGFVQALTRLYLVNKIITKHFTGEIGKRVFYLIAL